MRRPSSDWAMRSSGRPSPCGVVVAPAATWVSTASLNSECPLDFAGAKPVEGGIVGDAVDPGGEGRLAFEFRERLPGFEERILSQVPGVGFVAHHGEDLAVDAGAMARDQHVEGSEVASLASFHEYGVGRIIRRVRRGRRQGMRRRHGGNYSAME